MHFESSWCFVRTSVLQLRITPWKPPPFCCKHWFGHFTGASVATSLDLGIGTSRTAAIDSAADHRPLGRSDVPTRAWTEARATVRHSGGGAVLLAFASEEEANEYTESLFCLRYAVCVESTGSAGLSANGFPASSTDPSTCQVGSSCCC